MNTQSTQQASKPNARPMIGELLIEADLLQHNMLKHALDTRRITEQPTGIILTRLGYVSERDIKSTLLAQSLIAEGAIARKTAVAALARSARSGMSLTDAIEVLDTDNNNNDLVYQQQHTSQSLTIRINPTSSAELNYLIQTSRMVGPEVFQQAIDRCRDNNETIGRALLNMHAINHYDLKILLDAYLLIQTGKLTREEAARALGEMRRRHCTFTQVLVALKLPGRNVSDRLKMAELLTESGAVPERDCLLAVEQSLTKDQLLTETLVSNQLLTDKQKDAALTLVHLAGRGVLSRVEAIGIFTRLKKEGGSLRSILQESRSVKDPEERLTAPTLNLLIRAGLVNADDAARATMQHSAFGLGKLKSLLAEGLVSAHTLNNATKLQTMLASGHLDLHQAASALIVCDREHISAEQAKLKLGYDDHHFDIPEERVMPADQIKAFLDRDIFKILAITSFAIGCGCMVFASPLALPIQLTIVACIALLLLVGLPAITSRMVEAQKQQQVAAHQDLMDSARETKNRLKSLRSCRVGFEMED